MIEFLQKPEVVSIGGLIITILAGFGTLWYQKRREWLVGQSEKKAALYVRYFNAMVDRSLNGHSVEMDIKLTFEIAMTASKDVIKALGEFRNYLDAYPAGGSTRESNEVNRLAANLVKSMRLDCYGGPVVELEWLAKAIPIK